MKVQMLKMNGRTQFTVINDTDNDCSTQYLLYVHLWRQGRNGYRTRRKYLVAKCPDMKQCLAWIMDILRDESVLRNAISAKKIYAS